MRDRDGTSPLLKNYVKLGHNGKIVEKIGSPCDLENISGILWEKLLVIHCHFIGENRLKKKRRIASAEDAA